MRQMLSYRHQINFRMRSEICFPTHVSVSVKCPGLIGVRRPTINGKGAIRRVENQLDRRSFVAVRQEEDLLKLHLLQDRRHPSKALPSRSERHLHVCRSWKHGMLLYSMVFSEH